MDLRSLKIDKPEECPQGFLSICVEKVLLKRIELCWESKTDSAHNNILNTHLAQVLTLGVHPSAAVLDVLAQGLSAADEYIHLAPSRIAYYNRCVDVGPAALYLHSQELHTIGCGRGRWRRDKDFGQEMLRRIGRDAYLGASLSITADKQSAVSMVDELFSGQEEYVSLAEIWSDMAENFPLYSAFLHQIGIELGFIDALPPGLISS